MVLFCALEKFARLIVIGNAAVGFGEPQHGGFVARIELQCFIECSNGRRKILRGAQRFGQLDAQARTARLELDGAAEFVSGGVPIFLGNGLLREFFELGGRYGLWARRRLRECGYVKDKDEAQEHARKYSIANRSASVAPPAVREGLFA